MPRSPGRRSGAGPGSQTPRWVIVAPVPPTQGGLDNEPGPGRQPLSPPAGPALEVWFHNARKLFNEVRTSMTTTREMPSDCRRLYSALALQHRGWL